MKTVAVDIEVQQIVKEVNFQGLFAAWLLPPTVQNLKYYWNLLDYLHLYPFHMDYLME